MNRPPFVLVRPETKVEEKAQLVAKTERGERLQKRMERSKITEIIFEHLFVFETIRIS